MGGRLVLRRKGLEDLNVYRIQQEREAKVREDLNVPAAAGVPCEGQALALRVPGCVFFVARGPVPREAVGAVFNRACMDCARGVVSPARFFYAPGPVSIGQDRLILPYNDAETRVRAREALVRARTH